MNCICASSVVADKKLDLGGKGRDGLMLLLLLLKLLLFELRQLGMHHHVLGMQALIGLTQLSLQKILQISVQAPIRCTQLLLQISGQAPIGCTGPAQLLILLRLLCQRSLDRLKVNCSC